MNDPKSARTINVYCDESCHLEHDHIKVMVLGAVWARTDAAKNAARRLIEIKRRHGLRPTFDLKWVAVSPAKLDFFNDVVDYFFDNSDLRFRAVVIPDKSVLNHEAHGQTHDDWYYKMFFVLLKQILSTEFCYRIYLDIKDTQSDQKVKRLHGVMRNSMLDFDSSIIERVQQVRSHEVQLLQLGDLLMGAIGYANRGLTTSKAKLELIERIKRLSGFTLVKSTLPSEKKFNLLSWSPRDRGT
jgi:Protein of unknown function (DUF3800)